MGSQFVSTRSVLRKGETTLARRMQAAVAAAEDRAGAGRFQAALGTAPGKGRIVLARGQGADGATFWAGVSAQQLLGLHSWIIGATGSGKTYFALGTLVQVLRDGAHPVVVVDLKGELAELLTNLVAPGLAASAVGPSLLQHLRIIRPFDAEWVPELRITEREEGVSAEVQALTLAAALEEALGDDLGVRMDRILVRTAALAIERREPLTVIGQWLENPARFARDARESADAALVEYARTGFARENRSSIEALAARLDSFLFLPEARLALSAPRCVSFGECLSRGLTVIDLGNPPAGAERLTRFWAGILVGRLARAILSRKVSGGSPQAWVVFEEFQEGLGRHQVEQFSRLLALARYKKVGLAFINQQPGQIAEVSPTLLKVLKTNTGLLCLFRSNLEDAKAFGHFLPHDSGAKRKKDRRESLVEEIPRLPDRTFYLWLRQAAFGAQKVRSPRLDLAALQRRAADLPPETLSLIRRGTAAVSRADLEALVQRDAEAKGDSGVGADVIGDIEATDSEGAGPRLG